MSKKRQRKLTIVGISTVITVWVAALALLFSQPGTQSGDKLLPTLAGPLDEVAALPDTGGISPTLLPTEVPLEPPADSQPSTSPVSFSTNQNQTQSLANPNATNLNIPSEPVPNSMVIRFKPDMSAQERLDYITSLGGQIVQEIKPLNTVIISLPDGARAQSQSVNPGVLDNEPDYFAGALAAPNDALAAGQWGLEVVKAPQAWDLLPLPTPTITVAVIDSGICADHADLQGRIASGGWDFVQNDSTPQDEYGHGCAVSGIISANSNNGLGIAGVAPNTAIMPLRVLDESGLGRYSNVAAAIVYAVDNGAQAINLSLGGPNESTVLQDAVNYAETHGVTVIAAAGNGGAEDAYYPAAYPAVVAVGSVDQNLQRSAFSNYGPDVDLYAPGSNIMTTSMDGSFQTYSGTSVAAPYVTGVWALREAMDKALVLDGGIVSALYENDAPVATEPPPSELCNLSDFNAAETAYFDLAQQNAAQPGSVSDAQIESAKTAYLSVAGQCANVLYDGTITIDGGGISASGGEIAPQFQLFGTKWGTESPFNPNRPPASPVTQAVSYSFMPTGVSLAAKEAENGGGLNAFITAISQLPNNSQQCDLQGRIRQAFTAWSEAANISFLEIPQEISPTGAPIPFGGGEVGQVGDIRIGAQVIDGMKGELGHAYFPPPDPEVLTSTRSGDIFLDRAEMWGCAPGETQINGETVRVIDIGLVTLHEVGHALGMQHERAEEQLALMNPTYKAELLTPNNNFGLNVALQPDDKSGIQGIYGAVGVSAPAPTFPVDTDVNDNTPTFTWTDTTNGSSDYFEVQIYTDDNGQPGGLVFDGTTDGGTDPTNPNNKTFTIQTTLESLSYLWRVRSFVTSDWGPWSSYQAFSVTVGIASLRRPVEGETLSNGSVIFEWSPIIGNNSFRLQIATRPEFSEPLVFDADVPAGTSYTFNPPLDDGTYYWRVRGTNSALFSRVGTFIVDSNAPVVDLSAGNANVTPGDGTSQPNQDVTLSWPALDGIDDYQVQVDTSENFAGLLYLDRVFLDRVFLDRVFLDRVFLDRVFLDRVFLDRVFLDRVFLDRVFLDRVFLDRVFLDRVFLDRVFLDRVFLDRVFLDRVFLDRVFLDRFSLDKVFLDRVFLDRMLFDKVTASGGTVSLTLAPSDSDPDTIDPRISEGTHYWRVRARLADGTFGPWSVGRKFEVRTQPSKVVINEIKLTDPSWVEFHNTGTQAADLTNWKFFAYGPSGETQLLYSFPDGFTLQPNGYVVLYEGQGTNTDRTLFTGGAQIDWPLTAQTTLDDPNLLNQMGAIVSGNAGGEGTSEPNPPGIVVGQNGPLLLQGDTLMTMNVPQTFAMTSTPEANISAQSAGDAPVTALTNFNIAIGDTISNGVPGAGAGNIEMAGSNDTYTFPVTAGQIVYFDYISTSSFSLDWQLRSPSNVLIFNNTISTEVGRRVLTEIGDYILTVQDNSNVATGTYSFKIWGVADNNFSIAVGTTVSDGVPGAGAGNIEVPGAQDVYTFDATAGDILYFDGVSASASLYLTLTSPSSATIFSTIYLGGDGGRRTLTETGTYTLRAAAVSATSATTGTYSFKIWAVPVTPPFGIAIGDTISDGVPAAGAGNIEVPGAQDVYTFDATAGDILYFDGISTTASLYLTLTSPSSATIFSTIYLGGDGGRRTLTETGTYTLTAAAVSATSATTGTYSFKVWAVATPQNFAIDVGDTISNGIPGTGAGNIETPGAQDIYTFDATAGDIVFFDNLGASDFIYARLTGPTSGQIFNTSSDGGRRVLSETGTYTLTFGGFSDTDDVFGTYSFKLWPVAAAQNFVIGVGDTVSNGAPEPGAGNIESPGAQDIYTFSATAGDVVNFDDLGATDSIYWRLTSPSDVQIFNTSSDGGTQTLSETGTYTLRLGGSSDSDDVFGAYSFKLWAVPAPDEIAIAVGDTVADGVPSAGAGNIESPGARDIYTFTASAGQQVYFDSLSTNADFYWTLTSPTDTELFFEYVGYDAGAYTLTEAGIYTITVYDYYDQDTGTYGFKLWPIPEPQNFAIDIGDTVANDVPGAGAGNIESPGAQDIYIFSATAGDIVYFDVPVQSVYLNWRLTSPTDVEVFDQYLYYDAGEYTLDETGTYTITVSSNNTYYATGSYTFRLVPGGDTEFTIGMGSLVSDDSPATGAGNITPSGNVDTYVFAGAAGQTISLNAQSGGSSNLRWQLVAPGGAVLFNTSYTDQNNINLSNTGTYTLTVQASVGNPTFTGTYSFQLLSVITPQNFAISIGSTVLNGAPNAGAGNIEVPGARDIYTFDATAGQTVYFASLDNSDFYWELRSPSNSLVFSSYMYTSSGGRRVLSEAGTYTLSVYDYDNTLTGTYGFKIWNVPVADNFAITVGDMIADGVPEAGAGNLEQPGAQDVYTFSASAGQTVLFDALSPIPSNVRWILTSPSATVIFNSFLSGVDPQPTLADAGTYTLTVESTNNISGNRYSFKLWNVSSPQNFAIDIGDTVSNGVPEAGAGNIEETGSQDIYTFGGTAGQIVHFAPTGTSNNSLYWRLTNPSGNVIFDTYLNYNYDWRQVLPATGAYKLTVYGYNSATGQYGFTLWDVTQQTFNINIGDTVSNGVPSAGAGNIESGGTEDVYNFSATAGQVIFFDALSSTNSSLDWELRDPSNYQYYSSSAINSDVRNINLYSTGTYQLTVYGIGATSGSYSFKLWNVPDPEEFNIAIGDIVSDGVPQDGAGNLEQPGGEDIYSFAATEGQVVSFDAIGSTSGLNWELRREGNYVFSTSMSDTQRTLSAGNHTLRIFSYGDDYQPYSFRISEGSAGDYAITIGSTVSNNNPATGAGNIEVNGNIDTYVFGGAAGQFVTFDTLSGSSSDLQWRLQSPGGGTVFTTSFADQITVLLSSTGTYSLTVQASGSNPTFTGTYSFQLVENVAPASYAIAIGDTVNNGTPAVGAGVIEKAGDSDIYTFAATAGQEVTFDALSVNSAILAWRLLDPDNVEVFSTYFTDRPNIILAKTGTYNLTVQASAGNESFTGTYSFRLIEVIEPQNFVIDIGDTVSLDSPDTGAGNIEVPGAQDIYTFSGTAGQSLVFDALSASNNNLRWRLVAPPNSQIFNLFINEEGGQQTLPTTGEYTITVFSDEGETGTYSFRVIPFGAPTPMPTPSGDTAQSGPIFTVNTTVMNDDGLCGTANCSLIEAINAANAQVGANTINLGGSQIYTLAAVNNTTGGPNGLPDITSPLTINGGYSLINRSSAGGTPQFRFFHVSSGSSLTLNTLSLSNGDVGSGDGGAIFSSGSLTLSGVTLSNNAANQGGGLSVASGGSASINNSQLIANISTFLGGGFHVQPGGSATVITSLIDSNNGGSYGGGLYADGGLTITDSTISNNTAGGGAGFRACCGGTIAVTNSTIANNTATSYAGGIMTLGVQLNLVNSTISGNVVTAPAGGEFNGRGGAILNRLGGTVNISSSTIVGNSAAQGGGLANENTITVKNSLIASPASGGNCFGSAIATQGVNFVTDATCGSASPTLNIVSASALNLGALAYNGGATQTIALGTGSMAIDAATDCTTIASANVSIDQRGVPRPQGTACDAGAFEYGGDLHVTTTQNIRDANDGQCSLPEAIIAANTTTPSGNVLGECVPTGAIPEIITLDTNQTYRLTQVDNSTQGPNGLPVVTGSISLFMNNSTITRAGDAPDFRIFYIAPGGSLSLTNGGTISGGRLSGTDRGAAFFNQGDLSFSGQIIENNVTTGDGGAVYNDESSTAYLFGNIFRSNEAGRGGAIYNSGSLTSAGNANRFEDNQAADGGAIYSNGGAITLDQSSYVNNTATASGGALRIEAGTFSAINTTFSGNTAGQGGAIFQNSGTFDLSFSTLAENTTSNAGSGAVVYNDGSMTIDASIIANNPGGNCGGMAISGANNLQYPGSACGMGFSTLNPLLAARVDNGSDVYYPLLENSPAIDGVSTVGCPSVDGRGSARPVGASCEIGSWEGEGQTLTGSLTVTTTSMNINPADGLCSLPEAINAANTDSVADGAVQGECVPGGGADTITLGGGLTYTLSAIDNIIPDPVPDTSANGLPVISSPITINGNGSTITRNSVDQFRLLYVAPSGSLTINQATLSNGFGNPGGAIFADGALTLNFVSIADNVGSSGGGLYVYGTTIINNSAIVNNNTLGSDDGAGIFVSGTGTLVLTNSTVAGNIAQINGGGIITGAGSSAVVTIYNSTVANNIALNGAGIDVFGGSATVYNTIIANNFASNGTTVQNCSGNVQAGSAFGTNLQWPDVTCTDTILTADPLLGPLTGNPAYLPLGVDSPAIDAGDDAICAAPPVNGIDQRGVGRPANACDIGAYEATEAPALVGGTTGGGASLISPAGTQDFVRFGDTTIGPIEGIEWRGDNVLIPTSTTFNIGRDPLGSDTNHVTDWLSQGPSEGGQNFAKAVINEVYTGTNDLIELYNPIIDTVDLSGWELSLYDGNDQLIPAAPGANYTLRFPNGTLLRPGRFLVISEIDPNGPGSDDIDAILLGEDTVNWDDWNATGAVTLSNGLIPMDFVRFGGSSINPLIVDPPTGTGFTDIVPPPLPGESIGRNADSIDTDTAGDWFSQASSVGTINPTLDPPDNDTFANAIVVNPLPFRDTGNSLSATAANDPATSCGFSVGHTVWYRYTAANSNPVRFQTDGSDFDTVLAIFTLNGTTLQQVPGLCSLKDVATGSRLTLNPTPSTIYYIMVGGQLNDSGSYVFSANAPANDDIDDAVNIGTIANLPFRTYQLNGNGQPVSNTDVTAASQLVSDPSTTCATLVGRSVWYTYTAPDATRLRLRTTGTQFDTVIAIYTGSTENNGDVVRNSLVEVACNNDDTSDTTSDMGFTPVPGTTYFIEVAGNSDAGGSLLFEVDLFPAPANDLVENAYILTPDDDPLRLGAFKVTTPEGTVAAPFAEDTTGATATNDATASCGLNLGGSVWFVYTDDIGSNTPDTVVFQTFSSDYDTAMTIYTGTPGSLSEVACSDDVGVNEGSRLTLGDTGAGADVALVEGQTYYIRISGYFGETGDLTFNAFVPQVTPPENDNPNTPYTILFDTNTGNYTIVGVTDPLNITPFMQDTTGTLAALETAAQDLTCGEDVGHTVWYRYEAPERQRVVFDAGGSDFDTVIAAFVQQQDGDLNSLVEVGCNDDFEDRPQSKLALNTGDGVILYVMFGGYKQDRGNLKLGIQQIVPVVTDFTLVNAELSGDIRQLLDPDTLTLSELPPIAVRANTEPSEVGSVVFELRDFTSNALVFGNTDNMFPYSLTGNEIDGSYTPWTPVPGTYKLTALPYTEADGQGKLGTPLTIVVTINASNLSPVIAANAATVTFNEGLTATNSGTFSDPEGDTVLLTASIGTATADLSDLENPAWDWSFATSDGPADSQNVTITADDGNGNTSSVTFALVVNNVAPTAPFTPVFVSQNVRRLTFGAPLDVNADLPSIVYSYDCAFDNDGNEANDDFDVTGVTVTTYDCVFPSAGNYMVRGRIADKDGGFTDYTAAIEISPSNVAPIVNAGTDQTITLPTNSVALLGTASDDGLPANSTLTYAWAAIDNPPAPVVFSAPNALETTATFTVAGTYTLQLTVSDGELSGTDTLTVLVQPQPNQAPVVNAGSDQTIKLPVNSVALAGTVTDDGLPLPSNLTYAWAAIDNPPAPVVFSAPNALETTATFTVAGTYTLQLTASDGELSGSDTLTVLVQPPDNVAPNADAGLDQVVPDVVPFGTQDVTLNASGSTDNDGAIVSYVWTEGTTVLSNLVSETILLSSGIHSITLTVTDDDGATDTDEVTINVQLPANQAPVVNAGNDQSITLPTDSVALLGSVTDDGLPLPPTLTYTWTGPAGVTFSAPNALSTNATFSAAGTYDLLLTASDGQLSGSDTVRVIVSPQSTGTNEVTDQIDQSSDDVNQDGNSYDATNPLLWFGTAQNVSASYMGLRFSNLEIPQGATITEAHLEVYTATAQWIRMRILIGADAVDNSPTFTRTTRPSTRAFTTARLDYRSDTPWMAGTWNDIGDVKAVVQEIVNRTGWQSGNSLSILIKGLGSQWGRKFVTSYDGDPTHAPRLVISYAGGPPPPNNPPTIALDNPSVVAAAAEGQAATVVTGTFGDPDNNPVTLTPSVGTVQTSGNTWTWSYMPPDGPISQTVTITAQDSKGAFATIPASFGLNVTNVAPTAIFAAQPASTFPNNAVSLTFSSPLDVAADLASLTYTVDCGNGSIIQTTAPFSCAYAGEGSYTALGTVTDKDGGSTTYQAAITISATPAEPTTITAQVNGSSDDVNQNGNVLELNKPQIWVGTEGNAAASYTGLRFNNLSIPAGATITEAHLEFYTAANTWIGIDLLIAADAVDNSATFSNSNRPSTRTFTTARVTHHSNELWPANNWNTLAGNLSGMVQEVVSRAGWQSGNSLSIILKGTGTQWGRKFVTSYEGNPAFAPRLVINYTPPVVPLTTVEEPPVDLGLFIAPPVAAFTTNISTGDAPLVAQFSNASTGDIAGYTWEFGDGTTSTDSNPAHTYAAAGTYTVTLVVTGTDTTTSSAQAVITVNAPPTDMPTVEVPTATPPPPTEEATAIPTEVVATLPPPVEVATETPPPPTEEPTQPPDVAAATTPPADQPAAP